MSKIFKAIKYYVLAFIAVQFIAGFLVCLGIFYLWIFPGTSNTASLISNLGLKVSILGYPLFLLIKFLKHNHRKKKNGVII